MRVAANKINREGRGVSKAISVLRGVEPLLTKEYEAAFKNTGKPMVVVEADMMISLVNAEFERLSGYTREEIEGKKRWTEFVTRDDRKRMREYHRLRRSDPTWRRGVLSFGSLSDTGRSRTSCSPSGRSRGRTRAWSPCWISPIADRRRRP